ncbi:coiled-coil domain-containing protein 15-like [Plakobranchus ocellatus]|uniref:Coiled-coil domain-containing protein 15-like n=1 Tax=Plakobranchus ocellatus TaxID=259542 RepID=A0AAV3Y0G4_9GAST|nr:coiled-coil domain-containing protein 15-like [Plakobranchus ocellatus]
MASRQQARLSNQASQKPVSISKEIMRPIISTDVMGNRNVDVVPVGAWVEPADLEEQPDAIRAAQVEEERLKQLEAEKENRLKSFQREVKQRVWKAYQLKRQKLLQEAEEAFERERRVVRQSCLTGEMPRRDTCSHRKDLDMAIRQRLMMKYGEDVSSWKEESPVLQSHTEESHKATDQARQQLVSKKVLSDNKAEEKHSAQKPNTLARGINAPTVRSIVDIDVENLQHRKDHSGNLRAGNKIICESDDEDDSDEETGGNLGFKDRGDNDEECQDPGEDPSDRLQITFADTSPKASHTRKKRPGSSKRSSSGRLMAILPNTESEVAVRLRKQQAAISRRVFMDREREAVRENIRRQQHKKKIASLKREKEDCRQQLEALARQQLAPPSGSPGSVIEESFEEARIREELEDLHVSQDLDRRREEMRRLREMERYLDALRHRLMERVKKHGQQLPALCACAETVWDTHPETCANNCFFYHNHRGRLRRS